MYMVHQAEKLYEQLVEQLRESEASPTSSSAIRHDINLRLIKEALDALKELVLQHSFQDEQEEINFFKHTKHNFT